MRWVFAALILCAAGTADASTWQRGVPTAKWQKTDKAPTGYQIKGCAHYVVDGARVRQICDTRSPARNPDFWRYQEMIGGSIPPGTNK